MKSLSLSLVYATMMISSCGGGGNSGSPGVVATLSGNWQFTVAPPADGSYLGGLQGGFLLQDKGAVTGAASYAVSLSRLLFPCNSGSASITGTVSGQAVALTAVAGTQTFTFAGLLSLDGSTMSGTYTSTSGTAPDGAPCGTVQSGLQWSAVLVSPITGPVQGSFHSAGGAAGLGEQDFLVAGGLVQAGNTGSSSATVTGNLTFLTPITNSSDYPCFTAARVSGQISGNIVNLQIIGSDGSTIGQIGEPAGSNGVTGVNPVTFSSSHGSFVLNGAGPTYMVATPACPGNLAGTATAGDYGSVCLALNSASACQEPITLTPSALIFPTQAVGSPPTAQDTTLANTSGTTLGGITLVLTNQSGATNFTETDTCGLAGVPSLGQPFTLESGQSCMVTITFAPQETCAAGTPPAQCPSPLTATLTATSPNNGTILTVPITGTALSGSAVLTREAKFDAEGVSEARLSSFSKIAGTFLDQGDHAEIDW